LAQHECRKASTVISKELLLPPSICPSCTNCCQDKPRLAAIPLKYRSISSRENDSLPAGTGVCVVNTVLERTRTVASA